MERQMQSYCTLLERLTILILFSLTYMLDAGAIYALIIEFLDGF